MQRETAQSRSKEGSYAIAQKKKNLEISEILKLRP